MEQNYILTGDPLVGEKAQGIGMDVQRAVKKSTLDARNLLKGKPLIAEEPMTKAEFEKNADQYFDGQFVSAEELAEIKKSHFLYKGRLYKDAAALSKHAEYYGEQLKKSHITKNGKEITAAQFKKANTVKAEKAVTK